MKKTFDKGREKNKLFVVARSKRDSPPLTESKIIRSRTTKALIFISSRMLSSILHTLKAIFIEEENTVWVVRSNDPKLWKE